MNISVSPELEKWINDKVASGEYATTGELVWHALNLLRDQEKSHEQLVQEFNEDLQRRLDAIDRGEYVTAEEVERHFLERSAQRRAELSSGEHHS
jgi:antitoxin ParD1/3/4